MNAIDTNVLVRILVQDDDKASYKALKYVQQYKTVFISTVVLCETTWVLEYCYHVKKPQLISILENILNTEQFAVENTDVAWAAVREYKKINMDFADSLIGAMAKFHHCDTAVTFDKKAARSVFFTLLK